MKLAVDPHRNQPPVECPFANHKDPDVQAFISLVQGTGFDPRLKFELLRQGGVLSNILLREKSPKDQAALLEKALEKAQNGEIPYKRGSNGNLILPGTEEKNGIRFNSGASDVPDYVDEKANGAPSPFVLVQAFFPTSGGPGTPPDFACSALSRNGFSVDRKVGMDGREIFTARVRPGHEEEIASTFRRAGARELLHRDAPQEIVDDTGEPELFD